MDPKIVTLAEAFPHLDQHWINENIERASERVAANVPERYADATVTEPAVADWVRAVVAAAVVKSRTDCISVHTGPSLLMLGITGTGKTHQAYGAIRALAVTGIQCQWRFSTAADIYAALRPRPKVDSEEEFRRFAMARLLVIDDLGAAKGSEWVEEINYRLINHRYEHKMPTLITSNLLPKELGAALGERVTSRLVEMAARVVIEGSDRRRDLRPAV
jgi:DNA replication protein DnaC